MDARLHAERIDRDGRKVNFQLAFGDVPDGAMIRRNGRASIALGGTIRPWSFDGYGAAEDVHPSAMVEVLTPRSTVAILVSGYRPQLHASAVTRQPAQEKRR